LAKKETRALPVPHEQVAFIRDFKDGVNNGGRKKYVWMFGIIGAFVLCLPVSIS
jgi:hypothetical protein